MLALRLFADISLVMYFLTVNGYSLYLGSSIFYVQLNAHFTFMTEALFSNVS